MPSSYKEKTSIGFSRKFDKINIALKRKKKNKGKSMSIGVHTMLSMVWTKTLSQAEGMQEVYGDTWLHIPEQPDCPLYRGRTSIHIAF